MTVPSIGSTSPSTESGFNTIERPMYMIRSPPRRTNQVNSVFASRASSNISAQSTTPSCKRSTRFFVFAKYAANVSPFCLETIEMSCGLMTVNVTRMSPMRGWAAMSRVLRAFSRVALLGTRITLPWR